jgi:aminoglycoside/choline kinase family phosphotransferase
MLRHVSPLISKLFAETFGHPPAEITRLAADGSQRVYLRLSGAPQGTVVGAHGTDPEENRAFLSFSRAFRGIGLPVPEIYAARESEGVWLEEDLGDTTLFRAVSAARLEEPGGGFPPR